MLTPTGETEAMGEMGEGGLGRRNSKSKDVEAQRREMHTPGRAARP